MVDSNWTWQVESYDPCGHGSEVGDGEVCKSCPSSVWRGTLGMTHHSLDWYPWESKERQDCTLPAWPWKYGRILGTFPGSVTKVEPIPSHSVVGVTETQALALSEGGSGVQRKRHVCAEALCRQT